MLMTLVNALLNEASVAYPAWGAMLLTERCGAAQLDVVGGDEAGECFDLFILSAVPSHPFRLLQTT